MTKYALHGHDIERVDPGEAAVEGTQPLDSHYAEWRHFSTNTDIALAAQSYGLGWHDLAAKLVARHKENTTALGTQAPHERDPRAALARLAWNHWCNQFTKEKGNRAYILTNMRAIQASGLGMDTPLHRNIIQDMEATLKPRASKGKVEVLLDQLVELDDKQRHIWVTSRYGEQASVDHARFEQLFSDGLDVIPELLQHLDDFRLTRCLAEEDGYTWNIRIADVVAVYFHQWIGEELRYDLLQNEGRGVKVDGRQVNWWREKLRAQSERDYLVSHAFPASGRRNDRRANPGVLLALATRHPDDFLRIWKENAGQQSVQPETFVKAMQLCRCTKDMQEKLLLDAMRLEDSSWRREAAKTLAGSKEAEKVVTTWLQDLPDTVGHISRDHTSRNVISAALVYKTDTMTKSLINLGKRLEGYSRLYLIQQVYSEAVYTEVVSNDFLAFYRAFLDDTTEVKLDGDRQRVELSYGLPYSFDLKKIRVNQYVNLLLASMWDVNQQSPKDDWSSKEWQSLHDAVANELAKRTKKSGSPR